MTPSGTNATPARQPRTCTQDRTADGPLPADLLRKMNVYSRAANYLSNGQIYLYDNPLDNCR
jgi:phosphoketolase